MKARLTRRMNLHFCALFETKGKSDANTMSWSSPDAGVFQRRR
jgi:hypothetical protein